MARYESGGMGATDLDTVIDGRYRIVEVVGRGGMADVYRALDERLGRPVALKWLRQSVDDPREASRARSEALLLARLSHPALVTLFDAGVQDGRPYLVMELIDGPSLAVRAPSDPASVALVGAQLAEGLRYIHEQGLVHRDIKPANVLVASTPVPWERVKLADFGIARLVDATRLTATGTTIGTAAYLSPEQIRADPVGPPADIWSLGLVLLECLTGRRAYPGAPAEAAVARLHRAPDVPTDLPGGWAPLLRRMTDPDPDRRIAAIELVPALRSMPEGRGRRGKPAAPVGWAGAAAAADSRSGHPDDPWGAPAGSVSSGTEVLPESELDRAFATDPGRQPGAGRVLPRRAALATLAVAAVTITAVALATSGNGHAGARGPATTVARPAATSPTTAPSPTTASTVPAATSSVPATSAGVPATSGISVTTAGPGPARSSSGRPKTQAPPTAPAPPAAPTARPAPTAPTAPTKHPHGG